MEKNIIFNIKTACIFTLIIIVVISLLLSFRMTKVAQTIIDILSGEIKIEHIGYQVECNRTIIYQKEIVKQIENQTKQIEALTDEIKRYTESIESWIPKLQRDYVAMEEVK